MIRWLRFSKPAELFGFLQTCVEEPRFAPGSPIHDQLDRIRTRKEEGRPEYWIQLDAGDADVQMLEGIARAHGGSAAKPPADLGSGRTPPRTIMDLLQGIRLLTSAHAPRPGRIVLALNDEEATGPLIDWLWERGARQADIAFISPQTPRYRSIVRVSGLRELQELQFPPDELVDRFEAFAPVRSGHREPRCFVRLGFTFPLPDVEQLIPSDRELILIRPQNPEDAARGQEWITFPRGELTFFRRAVECLNPEMESKLELSGRSSRLVELHENPEPDVPTIRLSLTPREETTSAGVDALRLEIERQHQKLAELTAALRMRSDSEQQDVYFAYRFSEPDGPRTLNPSFASFMQQRVAVLGQYTYARCESDGSHLVVSQRPQSREGFLLQHADRVYYQPAAWRSAAVPLFLPWGTELRPRMNFRDSVEFVGRLLEQSPESEAPCSHVLWDIDDFGDIVETRIEETKPLLEQFRLLNSFRLEVARDVDAGTRRQLAEELAVERARTDAQIDELTQTLYDHVSERTAQLELDHRQMEGELAAAREVTDRVRPFARDLAARLNRIPQEWAKFLTTIIDFHKGVVGEEVEAFVAVRQRFRISGSDMRVLAARGGQLATRAEEQKRRLDHQLEVTRQAVRDSMESTRDLEAAAPQVNRVIHEIGVMYAQLEPLLAEIARQEAIADAQEREVSEYEARRRLADERLERIRPAWERVQREQENLARQEREVAEREGLLERRSTELEIRRERHRARLDVIAKQLASIERNLLVLKEDDGRAERESERLTEVAGEIEAQVAVLELWDERRRDYAASTAQRLGNVTSETERRRSELEDERPPPGPG